MKGRLDAVIPATLGDGGESDLVIDGKIYRFLANHKWTVDGHAPASSNISDYIEGIKVFVGHLVDFLVDVNNRIVSLDVLTPFKAYTQQVNLIPVFFLIMSDKALYFTGAILQNAKEDENLPYLVGDKIRITGLAIESDQQLDYRLIFWRKDTFDDTDLQLDEFISDQEMDLVTYGFQIGGAGQWYMSLTSLAIDYEDADQTKELHVSLQNLSATAKNAGATGEVSLRIYYEARE